MYLYADFIDGRSLTFPVNGAVELEKIYTEIKRQVSGADYSRMTPSVPLVVVFQYDDGTKVGAVNLANLKSLYTAGETE